MIQKGKERSFFDKEELLRSKSIPYSRDLLSAVLKEGERYTKAEAIRLCKAFLERKV